MNLVRFMCNERNHSICYIPTTYEVHAFKNEKRKKIKRHFCLSFSLLYIFICSCKFIIINTRANDIAHDENVDIADDENVMGSLMIQSI